MIKIGRRLDYDRQFADNQVPAKNQKQKLEQEPLPWLTI